MRRDPYLGFRAGRPLFEPELAGQRGSMVTASWREGEFNKQRFTMPKPEGTFRIFCFGGSTVFGFPFWDIGSFCAFLRRGLALADPFHKYEVINCGGMGYASYRIRWLMEESLKYQPNLVVLMMGHNEFLERRFYQEAMPHQVWVLKMREAMYHIRIYAILREGVLWLKSKMPTIPDLEQMETTTSSNILPGDTLERKELVRDTFQRERTVEHFAYNLEQIISGCQSTGVPLILLTMPSNMRDYPPNHSAHGPSFKQNNQEAWRQFLEKGSSELAAGQLTSAVENLSSAFRLDPDYALTLFEMGRVSLQTNEYNKACEYFQEALDRDAIPIRASSMINRTIREKAKEHKIPLADTEEAFMNAAQDNIPGDDLFLDHCHPTLEGQAMIAMIIGRVMAQNKLLTPHADLEAAFADAAKDILGSMDQKFLAEAYYRLAFETGVHLQQTERAIRYCNLALSLNPSHHQAPMLLEKLTARGDLPSEKP